MHFLTHSFFGRQTKFANTPHLHRVTLSLSIALLLTAIVSCGGGGGGGNSFQAAPPVVQPTPTPTPTPTTVPAVSYMILSGNTVSGTINTNSLTFAETVGISEAEVAGSSGSVPAQENITEHIGATVSTAIIRRPLSTTRFASRSQLRPARARAGTPPGLTSQRDITPLLEPYERRMLQALRTRRVGSAARPQSIARKQSLPTGLGSTANIWAIIVPIGGGTPTFTQVPSTLAAITAHAYLWIDNTVYATLSPADITAIANDFENGYSSDIVHFASPDYPNSAPGIQGTFNYCDSSGTVTGSGPAWIQDTDSHIVVFLVGSLGPGVGGYFTPLNYIFQAAANCLTGQPKSNEAPMIVELWEAVNGATFEEQEDMVRDSAHELQHLINWVQHGFVSNVGSEDAWINEGISMLSQDFAVHQMFPSVPIDVANALQLAQLYLHNPPNYSLTAFTGQDPSRPVSYNCAGCYGFEYLFQRYLYDRFGDDAYTHAMETAGFTSYSNIQNATSQNPQTLVGDFAIALMASNTGLTSDPRFVFQNLNLRTTYTDQFGSATTLVGPYVYAQNPGTDVIYTQYLSSFFYVEALNLTSAGEGVKLTDPSGLYNLQGGIGQR